MSRPSFVALLVASLAVPMESRGQEGTTITLTAGPSFVNFRGWGGSFGAAVLQLSIRRGFTPSTGAELTAFTLAPMGGSTAIPGCVPGAVCESRSTPNMLFGIMPSIYTWIAGSNIRVSGGVGYAGATGGEGLENRGAVAALLGIDWVSRSRNRLAPSLAVRVAQLGSPVAGARQLLLPGIGLAF